MTTLIEIHNLSETNTLSLARVIVKPEGDPGEFQEIPPGGIKTIAIWSGVALGLSESGILLVPAGPPAKKRKLTTKDGRQEDAEL